MSEEIPPKENDPEDIYQIDEAVHELGDYLNEISRVVHPRDRNKIDRRETVRTVEERFDPKNDFVYDDEDMRLRAKQHSEAVLRVIAEHPRKVARIDQMAAILNTTEDIVRFKQAINEISRLIRGKDTPSFYPEAEFDPELLGE